MKKPEILFVYHGPICADGFCCRWLAQRKWGPHASYLPMAAGRVHEELPPQDCDGRTVFLVDLSTTPEHLAQLVKYARAVVLLDHHKSAIEALGSGQADVALAKEGVTLSPNDRPARLTMVLNENFSGAQLLWRHWYGHVEGRGSEDCPWLVSYTADRDLWTWKLPNSRAISAALAMYPQDYETWERLHNLSAADLGPTLVRDGKTVLAYQEQLIKKQCLSVRQEEIGGHTVPTVNCTTLISETLEMLAATRTSEGVVVAFAAAWSEGLDGRRHWSLRSGLEGIDVSIVARAFGGGGHKHAAGFVTDM